MIEFDYLVAGAPQTQRNCFPLIAGVMYIYLDTRGGDQRQLTN